MNKTQATTALLVSSTTVFLTFSLLEGGSLALTDGHGLHGHLPGKLDGGPDMELLIKHSAPSPTCPP